MAEVTIIHNGIKRKLVVMSKDLKALKRQPNITIIDVVWRLFES